MKYLFIFSIIFFFFSITTTAQEIHHPQNAYYKKHNLALMWGNTIVPAGKTAHDEDCAVILPTWGINYTYFLNRRWALAWQNELELQSYVVEKHAEFVFEREFPFITALVLVYEPIHRLAIHAGPGYEIEKNENFLIMKAGMEYLFPLKNDFNLALGFSYDNKRKLYDAWTLGITVGKSFGKRHEPPGSH